MPNYAIHTKLGELHPQWRNANVEDGYTVAAVGDIIITQPMYAQLRKLGNGLLEVLADADLVVGNLEGSVLDLHRFDGYPEAESGFAWLTAPPEVAADLKRVGFDALARANNHATDWGVRGMQMTDDILMQAGLSIAGTGASLSAARAPSYVHGEAARASFVSFTSTFERNTPAIDAMGQIAARPGASTLKTTPIAMVSPAQLEELHKIRDAQPATSTPQVLLDIDTRMGFVTLFGQHYKARSTADAPVTLQYKMDSQDVSNILLNIRQAKQTSDFTVIASHTHEPNNWATSPPNFLPDLAHQAIDSGADLFVCHGPHQLRGIEIYKGKPIFYSLGHFCFMDNAQSVVVRDEWEQRVWRMLPNHPSLDPNLMTPAEFLEWKRVAGIFAESIWFESVIAVSEFAANGHVKQIKLYPIELGHQGRDALRGIPRIVQGSKAVEIMSRLQNLSRVYHTQIDIDAETGVGTINTSFPSA